MSGEFDRESRGGHHPQEDVRVPSRHVRRRRPSFRRCDGAPPDLALGIFGSGIPSSAWGCPCPRHDHETGIPCPPGGNLHRPAADCRTESDVGDISCKRAEMPGLLECRVVPSLPLAPLPEKRLELTRVRKCKGPSPAARSNLSFTSPETTVQARVRRSDFVTPFAHIRRDLSN
jgi:hypothetical protein